MNGSPKFSDGDVVELTTGGPEMVAAHQSTNPVEHWLCVWFDDEKHLHQAEIPEVALRKVSPQP